MTENNKLTPREAAGIEFKIGSHHKDKRLDDFITHALPRELQEFIHHIPTADFNRSFQIAKVALDIRLAEDAAVTADKLIKNSLILSNQTNVLITESQNLTRYTKYLLGFTITVVVFSVVLVILGCIDYHDKHKEWVNPLFNGHQ